MNLAAYAITALQEYGFDPEGTEENYYAVFDFGGGTTDFDFGVFRESKIDRYDYELIHFGENGDRTLGGENLLKLLAYEIFKANISTLLNPDPKNKGNEKIPFTLDAEKKNFVGSDALIKSSQEANANMHNLCEKLRPIWEDPQGDAAKKILESGTIEVNLFTDKGRALANIQLKIADKEKNINVDLQKILRDRIEQGIRNFFIAMKEAFNKNAKVESFGEVEEISIFLAGNSSKSALVKEIFNEYISDEKISEEVTPPDDFPFFDGALKDGYSLKIGYSMREGRIYKREGEVLDLVGVIASPADREKIISTVRKMNKAQKILGLINNVAPNFKIFPTLGTDEAHKIQFENGVEVNPNDIAAPTGKTGVAFGLLRCRDGGNVKITHLTPDENKTPFQFYVGRNKKRKFKTVIDKSTKFERWYPFIDAGNNFDILYSDKPEASSNQMNVEKTKRVTVTLDEKQINPELTVFIRAVKSNVIEYQIAEKLEDLTDAEKMKGVEPAQIILE